MQIEATLRSGRIIRREPNGRRQRASRQNTREMSERECSDPMPAEAGAGHWRDYHRGHARKLDPGPSPKEPVAVVDAWEAECASLRARLEESERGAAAMRAALQDVRSVECRTCEGSKLYEMPNGVSEPCPSCMEDGCELASWGEDIVAAVDAALASPAVRGWLSRKTARMVIEALELVGHDRPGGERLCICFERADANDPKCICTVADRALSAARLEMEG